MTAQASAQFAEQAPTGELRRSSPIVRTALALLSVQGVTWTTTLVGILVVPRFLGADRLGGLAAASMLAAIIALVSAFGTTNQIVRSVARDRSHAANIVAHAIVLRLGIWVPAMVVTFIAGWFVFDSRSYLLVVMLMIAATGVSLVSGALVAGLQGNQSLGRVSLVTAGIGVIAQAVTVLVVVRGGELVALSALALAVTTLTAIVTGALFWTRLRGPIRLSRTMLVGVASGGLGFLAWDLALQIYGAIDYLLLATLTDATTVGNYAFAYRLAGIPVFASTIATAAIYPVLAAAARKDDEWFRRVLAYGIRLVLIVTLPLAIGLAALAPEITKLVAPGQSFNMSAPLLIILAFHIPLAAIHTVMGAAMFARDLQRRMAVVGWTAAALSVGANVVAIPAADRLWSNGAIGAAAVTVAIECFVGFWIWRGLGAHLERRRITGIGLRALLACAAMALAARASLPLGGVFLAVPVGGFVYAIGAIGLRLVTWEQVRRLRFAAGSPGDASPSAERA